MSKRTEIIEAIMENFRLLKHSLAEGFIFPKDSPITPSQGFVLHFVAKREKSSVKEIAEKMRITSSAATQLCDALVKNGILERKEDAQDRRAVVITLSPAGKEHVAFMKKRGMAKMIEIFSPLSDSEMEEYLRLNQKIADQIRK